MRVAIAKPAVLALLSVLVPPAGAQAPWSGTGELQDSDPADSDGRRYDDHTIPLAAGQRYSISVDSTAFDPVARLYRPGNAQPIAENDDSGDGFNSRIGYTPSESGNYTLRVTTFGTGGRGAYSAAVEARPALSAPSTFFSRMEATIWRVYTGALSASDPEAGDGRFDDYLVSFAAGQRRMISLDAEDFDAVVQVYPAERRDGEPLAEDDDSGGDFNALLIFTAEAAGSYVIRVTSFDEELGPYRLRVSE